MVGRPQLSEPEHQISGMIHVVSSLDTLYADLGNYQLDSLDSPKAGSQDYFLESSGLIDPMKGNDTR